MRAPTTLRVKLSVGFASNHPLTLSVTITTPCTHTHWAHEARPARLRGLPEFLCRFGLASWPLARPMQRKPLACCANAGEFIYSKSLITSSVRLFQRTGTSDRSVCRWFDSGYRRKFLCYAISICVSEQFSYLLSGTNCAPPQHVLSINICSARTPFELRANPRITSVRTEYQRIFSTYFARAEDHLSWNLGLIELSSN